MSDSFKSLFEVFSQEASFKNVRDIVARQAVLDNFFALFPGFAGHVTPVKLEKSVLTLAVDNSVMRSELKFHESEIIKKINDFARAERVTKIKFQA